MNKEELLENYSKRLGSKGKTRNLYLKYVTDFLEYSDGNFDRETVEKYLEHLRKQHKYSEGSISFIFGILRTLFNRNSIEWPFARGDAPQIHENKVQAPALHPKTIIKMIQAVKEKGGLEEKAFLSLSTTYGLRKVEMKELTQSDVRIKDRTIHIATAKHGRERTHIIPGEIVPYLKEYNFDTRVSDFGLFTLWYQIEYLIGLNHIDQVGWHSVRRTVNTLLRKKLSDITVKSFMRWKQRTSSDMSFRYSAIKFVGEEEETTEVVGEALDVDSEIFKVHPFIEYWR